MIIKAVERNGVELVNYNTLEENIQKKMDIFRKHSKKYDCYVNIGGGVSSIGSSISGRLLADGYHRVIHENSMPRMGTMFMFAEKGIPVIHLSDFVDLARSYNLPEAPVPLPEPGVGKVFVDERYNVTVAIISLIILSIMIAVVIFFDHSQMKLRDDEIKGE